LRFYLEVAAWEKVLSLSAGGGLMTTVTTEGVQLISAKDGCVSILKSKTPEAPSFGGK